MSVNNNSSFYMVRMNHPITANSKLCGLVDSKDGLDDGKVSGENFQVKCYATETEYNTEFRDGRATLSRQVAATLPEFDKDKFVPLKPRGN